MFLPKPIFINISNFYNFMSIWCSKITLAYFTFFIKNYEIYQNILDWVYLTFWRKEIKLKIDIVDIHQKVKLIKFPFFPLLKCNRRIDWQTQTLMYKQLYLVIRICVVNYFFMSNVPVPTKWDITDLIATSFTRFFIISQIDSNLWN